MTSTPFFAPPFTHRPVDPVGDLDLLHTWVTQERARFWGMTDHTREEVGEVYAYLDSLGTHHAYLDHERLDARGPSTGSGIERGARGVNPVPEPVEGGAWSAPRQARGALGVGPVPELVEGHPSKDSEILDAAPVAVFQTYEPEHDPVGEAYDVQPGDLGVHLFVGPGERRPGFTGNLVRYLLGVVLEDPSVRRIVVEPDVLNERSVARFRREGFEVGPVVDLGHKTAQLAFLPRPR